ncbi:Zinc finger c2hc domain-containing protein, partial [Globisporangium splendens]
MSHQDSIDHHSQALVTEWQLLRRMAERVYFWELERVIVVPPGFVPLAESATRSQHTHSSSPLVSLITVSSTQHFLKCFDTLERATRAARGGRNAPWNHLCVPAFLFDTKVMYRKGNFKGNEGEHILRRIRGILDTKTTELDLSDLMLCDDFFVDLLAPFVRAKTCKLKRINLSDTHIGVNGAVTSARTASANATLETLQLSNVRTIPVLQLQNAQKVDLSGHTYNHLDAAVLGTLLARERKLETLDMSRNNLTGSRASIFHGLATLFQGLARCHSLKQINLHAAGLRSEGLVDLTNAIQDYVALENLVLSSNQIASNGCGEKTIAGVQAFCGAIWQSKTLVSLRYNEIDLIVCIAHCCCWAHNDHERNGNRSLADNELDYLSYSSLAKMLAENHTVTTLDLSQNPIADAGSVHLAAAIKKNAALRSLNAYRDLAKAVAVNPTRVEIELPPPRHNSKHAGKYLLQIRDGFQGNVVLRELRRGFQKLDTTSLNGAQRTNFVGKLQELSESELQKLDKMHILEDLDVANEVAQQHGSNLRYYSTSANTKPLKRLLWILETRERELHLQDRATRKQPQRADSGLQSSETRDDHRDEYDDDDDYDLSSFEIHLKQCKKLWLAQEELKPKSERRPIPKTPPGLGQMSESEFALSGSGKVDRDAIEAMNRMMQESFNVHGMEKCENCGRTFAEGRLAIHARSCHGNNITKRVGDGAAPRNRKDKKLHAISSSGDADNGVASSSSSNARTLSGSLPSNRKRKRIPSQEATGASATPPSTASSRASLHTPLSQSISQEIHIDDLRRELTGTNKPSAIATVQAKLDHWEATTLSTLQEIRDLKELFTQLQS